MRPQAPSPCRRAPALPRIVLVIMAKEPRMGRVKTRLARAVGVGTATQFQRTNLSLTTRRLVQDRRWQTLLAVAPDKAHASALLPPRLPRMGQGRGDIGARMDHVARHAPAGNVLIIGADIPAITRDDIARAAAVLRGADAVFGPASDGGFWLVGLTPRMRRQGVFRDVRWSGPHALSDTCANLQGRRVAFVAIKHDVDEAADLSAARVTGRLLPPR